MHETAEHRQEVDDRQVTAQDEQTRNTSEGGGHPALAIKDDATRTELFHANNKKDARKTRPTCDRI
jgi:hypothetical protein